MADEISNIVQSIGLFFDVVNKEIGVKVKFNKPQKKLFEFVDEPAAKSGGDGNETGI